MSSQFYRIEKWAHRLLARLAAWLVYGLCLAADRLLAGARTSWSWLRRWRHLPEGGVVATVVKDDDKR